MSDTTYYFDYAASAPRRDEVAEAMAPWMHGVVGNPSGMHREARRAREAIEEARDAIAEFVGGNVHDVIFTGGGTESCYLAIAGRIHAHRREHPLSDIVISSVEHSAVRKTAELLAATYDDVRVRLLDVDRDGVVTSESLWENLTSRTALVSVMTIQNETGVFQPLPVVATLTAGAVPNGGVSHTDAIAAASHMYLGPATEAIDMVSIAAHKLGGPVNSGALILRRDIELIMPNQGGGQERGHRGGTVDVAAAVGLAAACRATAAERADVMERIEGFRLRFENAVSYIAGVDVTARGESRIAGVSHLTIEGVNNEELIFLLDEAGICVSGGSSCASGALEPSPVLLAMGYPPELARSAVRFSYGHLTTAEEIDYAIGVLADAVYRLRGEK